MEYTIEQAQAELQKYLSGQKAPDENLMKLWYIVSSTLK